MEWEKGRTTEMKNVEIRDMESWCMKGSSTQHAEGHHPAIVNYLNHYCPYKSDDNHMFITTHKYIQLKTGDNHITISRHFPSSQSRRSSLEVGKILFPHTITHNTRTHIFCGSTRTHQKILGCQYIMARWGEISNVGDELKRVGQIDSIQVPNGRWTGEGRHMVNVTYVFGFV